MYCKCEKPQVEKRGLFSSREQFDFCTLCRNEWKLVQQEGKFKIGDRVSIRERIIKRVDSSLGYSTPCVAHGCEATGLPYVHKLNYLALFSRDEWRRTLLINTHKVGKCDKIIYKLAFLPQQSKSEIVGGGLDIWFCEDWIVEDLPF